MFWIRCTRSGGMLGYATAPLKANGVMRTFATREEARAEAKRLDRTMNGPYAVASYSYVVMDENEF